MSTREKLGAFTQMPDTVEDLEVCITEAVAEANAVICNNPSVLEEYERRCKQVYNLRCAWNQFQTIPHIYFISLRPLDQSSIRLVLVAWKWMLLLIDLLH